MTEREALVNTILNACESGDAVWAAEALEIADAILAEFDVKAKGSATVRSYALTHLESNGSEWYHCHICGDLTVEQAKIHGLKHEVFE